MLVNPSITAHKGSRFGAATVHVTVDGNKTIMLTKADIALHGNPISELRDVTCHMGSHSVTCHPTRVNAPA